jgi:hypothetical protein
MKRSEALNLIQNEWNKISRDGMSEAPDEYKLDVLLHFMTDVMGMLPPPYYDPYFDNKPECSGMINEWEEQ